jgi:hypothetical protein
MAPHCTSIAMIVVLYYINSHNHYNNYTVSAILLTFLFIFMYNNVQLDNTNPVKEMKIEVHDIVLTDTDNYYVIFGLECSWIFEAALCCHIFTNLPYTPRTVFQASK